MGCDIHFFAEKKNPETGKWEFLPAPNDGWSYAEEMAAGKDYVCPHPYRFGVVDPEHPKYVPGYDNAYPDEERGLMRDWFDDRNYDIFAMLADVRNYHSVVPILPADVEGAHGDRTPPHTRGWPDDCCPELEEQRAEIDHTPSWLTVAEMWVRAQAYEMFAACLQEMLDVADAPAEDVRAVFYFDS